MSAIPCASVSMKTMADGTLRISFDVEPKDAQAAFALFSAPGTPAAIAALKTGYQAAANVKPKGGPLSIEAAAMCRNPEFLKWGGYDDETNAAWCMRQDLGIDSRAEIDSDPNVAEHFLHLFRGPFMKYMLARNHQ